MNTQKLVNDDGESGPESDGDCANNKACADPK